MTRSPNLAFQASNENRAKYARAVQPASSTLARAVYRQGVAEAEPGVVVLAAGSTASGKTTSLKQFPVLVEDAALVDDSTLANVSGAMQELQAALDAGHEVGIIYTTPTATSKKPSGPRWAGRPSRAGR